jgi:hypothetical protein
VKLKPITEKSWLVLDDTGEIRVGLLTESREQYILMAKGEKRQFLDRHAVNTFFNENIFDNVQDQEITDDTKKEYFVRGYPVDFDTPNEVIMKGVTLPLFSKKVTSDVYYCAGYYCLKFPKNWRPAYCPKLSTIQSYEYVGPFKTEIEMRASYNKVRKT